MNSKRLKILLSLFTINSLSLYLYFSFQPDRHRPPSGNYSPPGIHPPLSAKPWPILPSYLPWSHDQRPPPLHSCEAYFGNGFSDRVDPLIQTSVGGRGGWFRCFYSETLRSSICEGGRIRMTPDRIRMSIGGEKLESVIGRGEDDELPKFDDGAFEIETDNRSRAGEKMADEYFLDRYINEGAVDRHTMRELIDSIRLVDDSQFNCSQWIEEPVILVTRFEYANLFHTITDWYSTYVASRVTGLPNRPHLVFVDGHCETPLEETWTALYSSITYAKNFTGPVCFRHAILAPLGYETPLFRGLTEDIDCRGAPAHDLWKKPDNRKTARLSEFGEMIRSAFGFPVDRHRPISPPRVSGLNILFVRRENYLAHPRHGGKIQTRLTNEQEVFDAVINWASNYSGCELNVVNGLFAHMPMKEQVRAIQDAAVIVGAHGAGLTHIVSADGKAVILEIISSQYRRPHFELIARWKGLEYHAMNLAGSYADPLAVVDRLSGIVRSLRC